MSDENQNDPMAAMQMKLDAMAKQVAEQTQALAQQQTLNTSLMQRFTEQPPIQQAAPVEVNPELRLQVDAVVGAELKALREQMGQQRMYAQAGELRALAGQRAVTNPGIVERAEKLLAAWHKDPRMANIATPTDALNFAVGEAIAKGEKVSTVAEDQRNEFNRIAGGTAGQRGPPPSNQPQLKLPDLSNKNPRDAAAAMAAYYEKKLEGGQF